MGTLIVVSPPESDSSWDKVRIYRATSRTGTYGKIVEQAITNLSHYDETGTENYWYKYSYYNTQTTIESDKTEEFQCINSYTSVKKVQQFIRTGTPFSDTTNPSIQQIMDMIKRAEDILDSSTNRSWRLRYSGTETGDDQDPDYEFYDIDFDYQYQTGRPVYLNHRKIREFSASDGDVFEIFNGSNWENFLAYTQDRNGDWWADWDKGILFIKRRWSVSKPMGLRLKYRYGETVVPRDVEDATIKLVAIDLYTTENRTMILPEGSNGMNYRDKSDKWKDDVDSFIMRKKEIKVLKTYL